VASSGLRLEAGGPAGIWALEAGSFTAPAVVVGPLHRPP